MESSPNPESQTNRSAETENVGNEVRKAISRVGEHFDECRVIEDEADRTVWKNDPGEKCKAKSPDETRTGAGGAPREESAERNAEDGAVDKRLRCRSMNRCDAKRSAECADDEADYGKCEQARLSVGFELRLIARDRPRRDGRT